VGWFHAKSMEKLECYWNVIWRFPEMGVPQNRWFLMENPSINGWFGGTPIWGNPHIYISTLGITVINGIIHDIIYIHLVHLVHWKYSWNIDGIILTMVTNHLIRGMIVKVRNGLQAGIWWKELR
jgi:hypothetical protein